MNQAFIQKNLPLALLPRVNILTTGGTIVSKGATSLTLLKYSIDKGTANNLVNAIPELENFAIIETEEIANIDSPSMTADIWLKVAKHINEIFTQDSDVAGVVITHGTDTLEETSYFLTLTLNFSKPVVFVGSQRPATLYRGELGFSRWIGWGVLAHNLTIISRGTENISSN